MMLRLWCRTTLAGEYRLPDLVREPTGITIQMTRRDGEIRIEWNRTSSSIVRGAITGVTGTTACAKLYLT